MHKLHASILTFFVLLAGIAPLSFSAQQKIPLPSPSALQWERAKELQKKGSYIEAREIYEILLQQKPKGKKAKIIREKILKAYGDLNIKIIFSKVLTPDSFFYTVETGDTLKEIAKKHETTIELLKKSNGLSNDRILPGMKLKVHKGRFSISVKKRSNTLHLSSNKKHLKTYRVSTGANGSTPVGTFIINNKLKDPAWFYAGVVAPPGSSENILGTRWLGFDKPSYGIHGTTLPETIGTQASKGCVRMLNTDVEELYELVPLGTKVIVKE